MANNNESTDDLLLHVSSKGVDNHYSSLYWVIFFFTLAFGNSVRKIIYSNNTDMVFLTGFCMLQKYPCTTKPCTAHVIQGNIITVV